MYLLNQRIIRAPQSTVYSYCVCDVFKKAINRYIERFYMLILMCIEAWNLMEHDFDRGARMGLGIKRRPSSLILRRNVHEVLEKSINEI